MTPLIQEMVSLAPEQALNFHWFDMTAAYKHEQAVSGEILEKPLPYPQTALVCAYEDKKTLLMVNRINTVTGVLGWLLEKKSYKRTTPFAYMVTPEGVKCRHLDGTYFDYRTSSVVGVIAFIAAFLESLEYKPAIGHLPLKRLNWEKKIRQGKVPTYDWTTVVVEPSKPKTEPQGGTHASPRWHERRGHWRTMKNSKKVWVKNCEVGNKALGAVFHDYKIKDKA